MPIRPHESVATLRLPGAMHSTAQVLAGLAEPHGADALEFRIRREEEVIDPPRERHSRVIL